MGMCRCSRVNATNAAPFLAKRPKTFIPARTTVNPLNTVNAVVPKNASKKIKISHIMKNQKRMVIQNFLTQSCEAFLPIFPRTCGESRPVDLNVVALLVSVIMS